MQIIFLPTWLTILICFPLWFALQWIASYICLHLPESIFAPESFFFKTHGFEEEGQIYEKLFRLRSWKHLLPDGGVVWNKDGFKKKHLESFSVENLERFLIESARAELTHWLAIPPFLLFGLFTPPQALWFMLAYALMVNLPCIIAQRFNRPRAQRLLQRKRAKLANLPQ